MKTDRSCDCSSWFNVLSKKKKKKKKKKSSVKDWAGTQHFLLDCIIRRAKSPINPLMCMRQNT